MSISRFVFSSFLLLAACGGAQPQCSFVGTWAGTYSCSALNGVSYNWVLRSDGTATGTIGGSSTVEQTWSVSGTTLTIADNGCAGVQGTYTLAYESSCNQATLTRISDTCSMRGDCVNGLHVTRQ
jgi:hypothetical protein